MNVVKIYGGCGNQMFQYAFGRAMEHRGAEVVFDNSWYNTPHGERPYILDKFNTRIKLGNVISGQPTYKENGVFTTDLLDFKDMNFAGYWQSPKYHEEILHNLKEELTLKPQFYTSSFLYFKEKIENENSVALHVRRGDFLNHHRHQVTPLEYYQRAIRIISTMIVAPVFYVFSDDIPWCKENFKDLYIIHLDEHLDFELIKLCKHHIMPNSTFSLWASYLSNSNGINIAPDQWDKYPADQKLRVITKHLLPDNWIKLCTTS